MAKREEISAGLLLYRRKANGLEVLLAHPGGPFWAKKDKGAWSIPKGLVDPGEELLDAARREFEEETAIRPEGPFRSLENVPLKSGKIVHAWACEGDADASCIRSNTVTIEWPPRSGRKLIVPEIDRCEWFDLPTAKEKINPAQVAFIDRLQAEPIADG